MKKNTKLKIGAVLFSVFHFALTVFAAVVFVASAFGDAYGGSTANQELFTNIVIGVMYVLAFPLMYLNYFLLTYGLPDWIQFISLISNSILWGYVFYRIIKYFGDKKKENKKE